MSDEVTPNDMPGAGAATEPSETQQDATPDHAEATGLTADEKSELEKLRAARTEERLWERRAKANVEDAKRWRDQQEKLGDPMERINELSAKFEASEKARIRSDVARTECVDIEDIRGDTEDEMLESARRWKTRFEARVAEAIKAKTSPAAAPAAEVTSSGTVEGQKQLTQDDLKSMTPKQVIEARNSGQLDDLLGK